MTGIIHTQDTINIIQRLERLFLNPNREDIFYFLTTQQPEDLEQLYKYADEVRKKYVGDGVHLRAIIEFSNYCRRGCLYCGINRSNTNTTRYRIPKEEIVSLAQGAYEQGYRTLVLQSGEDPFYTMDDYLYIIRGIKAVGEMAITLACGEKTEEEYRQFFEAGADRYLLKHETSDEELYNRLNPGMTFENRIQCLKTLKKIGFQTGSGIMVGLPGQTLESIANDIMLFYELDIDMIGCGPFIPHPQTSLKASSLNSEDITYRVLALNRVVTKDTHLPATTALSVVNESEGRKLALQRGADVVMPNITPFEYRRLYEIYPNKKRAEVSNKNFRDELKSQFESLGRFISDTPGHRIKKEKI